uniref:FBD domain-containing protein n=1 Tax=Chenopodium quinoa TaxID=63459 RepID=A0A803L7F0_CHEQI
MCVKEAAKTSILSRQWRYKWTSIQFLNFNLESLRIPVTAIDDQSAVNKYSNIINTVLFRHSGNVQKFKMTMFNKNRHYEVPDEFIRWMYYLFDHGIQELILEGWNLNIPYIFPSYIFSCKSLVVLRLQCCIFTSPLSIIALPKLKTLDLSNAIDACNRCFEMFISQCPLLENLRLYDVDGILDLTINAPMLKSCVLKGTFESIHLKNATLLSFLYLCPYGTHGRSLEYFEPVDYFQSFFQLKALRELTVHGESIQNLLAGNCPEARVKNLPDLRELTVYELFPGNLVMVSSLFSLIRSCSNLQYLEIHVKDSIYSILPSLEEFLKAMGDPPKCFQHVKSIHLVEISRTMHEMELVKFLLINSPSLGKMIVKSIHKDTCEEHTKMLKDLLSFNRASCKVQIILLSQQELLPKEKASESCHAIDKEALLDFKHRITDDPSQLLGSWLATTDCCTAWEGIACDPFNGRVIKVSRPSAMETSMSGTLSPFLGNLTYLQVLDLSDLSELSGPIPPQLGKLSQLEYLSLNINELIGPIPSSIGQLASLQVLDLSDNKLTGVLPDSLGNLSNCFDMNLQNNMITGKIPSWMSKLNLSWLMLAKTGLKGELPSWLSSLPLGYLDLSSNELTGRFPTWIGNMSDLWYLNISYNKFYSTIPKEFKNMLLLTDLDLHSNNFSGPLDFIFDKNVDGPLGHYNTIDVSRNKFTGPIDKNVGNKLAMNTISSLILSNNPLGGRIPKSIGNLTQMRLLEMVRDKLSGTIPEEISNADTLRIIKLSRNYLTGRVPKMVINLKWLEKFEVLRNKLSGEIPAHKANFPASAFFGNPGLCGLPLPALESCHAIDEEALLDFKHKITHDPSQLLRTWLPNTDCCTVWEGVDCNPANGRVVNVSRPGVQSGDDFILDTSMSGTLSPFLGNLTYLQLLDLSNLKELTGPIPPQLELELSENQFSGPIPSSIVDLISLTSLTLHDNKLSGKIPFEIGKLKSLNSLHLSLNRISRSIPDSIGKLSKLQDLSLSHNKLTGPIPSSIGKLVSLQAFSLSNNRLTGVLPNSIGNLPKIQYISLENNMITGNLPSSLGNLTTLITMVFANNRFVGQIPRNFGNLKSLMSLDLSKNQLIGPVPYQLTKVKDLQVLNLSYNPLGLVKIPSWLSKLNLFWLMLAKTGIKGELPRWFSSSSIGYLDLSSNKLTGKLPPWIGNMSELWFLNISYNEFYSTIPKELKNLSLLSDLDLHSNKFSGPLG